MKRSLIKTCSAGKSLHQVGTCTTALSAMIGDDKQYDEMLQMGLLLSAWLKLSFDPECTEQARSRFVN